MKVLYQIALASLVFSLSILAPASAYASSTETSARPHELTYHDRTPRVHTHGTHSHRH
jgi:hypothetical protein